MVCFKFKQIPHFQKERKKLAERINGYSPMTLRNYPNKTSKALIVEADFRSTEKVERPFDMVPDSGILQSQGLSKGPDSQQVPSIPEINGAKPSSTERKQPFFDNIFFVCENLQNLHTRSYDNFRFRKKLTDFDAGEDEIFKAERRLAGISEPILRHRTLRYSPPLYKRYSIGRIILEIHK